MTTIPDDETLLNIWMLGYMSGICTTVGAYVDDTTPQERHAYAQVCGAQLRHDPGARFEVIDSVTRMLNGEQRGGFTTLNVTEANE